MSTSFRYESGSLQSLMTTELNSLASTQGAIASSAYDNSAAGNQFFWADFELVVTYGTAPTAGGTVDLYLLETVDGTNYGDGTSGASPVTVSTHYVGSFPLRAVTSAQRIIIRGVPLSPVAFKAQLINNGGQAMTASGNTLKMLPYREQGV